METTKKETEIIWIDGTSETEYFMRKDGWFRDLKIATIQRIESKGTLLFKSKILFPISKNSKFPNSYYTLNEAQEAIEYFWDRLKNQVSNLSK